jgi:hypothetical protein
MAVGCLFVPTTKADSPTQIVAKRTKLFVEWRIERVSKELL